MAKCVCWKCLGSGFSPAGGYCDECWGYPYSDCTDEEYEANEERIRRREERTEDEWDDYTEPRSERAQVVEDAIREDAERQNANNEKHCEDAGSSSSAWWIDVPIPFTLTPKALAEIYPYYALKYGRRAQ